MSHATRVHLKRLERLYEKGFHDAALDLAIEKMVRRQIERDRADLKRVEQVLAEFERKYNMSSDDFWRAYQAGQLADTADFLEWNAFCKMRQRLLERLHILEGELTDEHAG